MSREISWEQVQKLNQMYNTFNGFVGSSNLNIQLGTGLDNIQWIYIGVYTVDLIKCMQRMNTIKCSSRLENLKA